MGWTYLFDQPKCFRVSSPDPSPRARERCPCYVDAFAVAELIIDERTDGPLPVALSNDASGRAAATARTLHRLAANGSGVTGTHHFASYVDAFASLETNRAPSGRR